MTTLVTGAGIIGCHTARLLAERGDSVVLLDRHPHAEAVASIVSSPRVQLLTGDVTDFSALMQLSAAHGVDTVVHTAALLSTAIRRDPLQGIHVNVMGTANILELARQQTLRRVVLASSSTVGYQAFEGFDGAAFPEDFAMRFLQHRPASIYVGSKMAGEYLALLYRDLYGIGVVALAVCGRRQRLARARNLGAGQGPVQPAAAGAARRDRGHRRPVHRLVRRRGVHRRARLRPRQCGGTRRRCAEARRLQHRAGPAWPASTMSSHPCRRFIPRCRCAWPSRPPADSPAFPHVRTAASDISAAARELGWTPRHSLHDAILHYAPLLD